MKKIIVCLLTILTLSACSINEEYKADSRYLGINLSAVKDYSSEFPFKDIFKMSREWRMNNVHQDYVTYIQDENGWITDLNGNDHAIAFLANSYLNQTNYVMTYEGKGEITFSGPFVEITNKEEGRIEFTIKENDRSTTQNNYVRIDSIEEDYIRDIKIFESKFENDLDDIFNPKFIENISIFSDFRFMDWMDTNDSTLSSWEDRPKKEDYNWTINGVPLEVMVELCNKVKANPWFCMPHSADDNFVKEFALYVNNNLDSNLTVYLENSNETWNGIFKAQSYNLTQGKLHNNINNNDANWKIAAHYYAQRSVEMFNIWDTYYENNLIKVLASQSSNYGVATTILNYTLEDGTKAGSYADALAIAPYIGHSTKVGIDFTNQDEIFNHLKEEIEVDLIEDLNNNKKSAVEFSLDLICYEAGQHLADSSSDDKTDAFILANRSNRMGSIYNEYLNTYKELIGTKMFLFSSCSTPSKYGSWGLLEYQEQLHTDAIKYKTVKEWIMNNPKV